jgi:hypothetical protein
MNMSEKKLVMIGIHKETLDNNGKVITPASIIKIYEDGNKDCFEEEYLASYEQIYARKNKKINYNNLSIDDFKGSKGLKGNFYNINQLNEDLEMFMNDGYKLIRMTKHNENNLADNLFKIVKEWGRKQTNFAMNF